MKILFLTDNFSPEVNAPATRTREHCREWVSIGHSVTVITCVPNYPQGKVYSGYSNKLWQAEIIDGIKVIRVWSYMASNSGTIKRIADYMSFMITSCFASMFVFKSDLVIGTSPQFFTACSAFVVSRFKRIPFVFELRDLWPESIKVVGALKNTWILDVLEKLELFLYSKADLIVSVTHSFKNNLEARGIKGEKIEVVTNGVDLSTYFPREKNNELEASFCLSNKFVAGYIGTIGMAHSLDTVLKAAKLISEKDHNHEVCFLIIGDGAEKLGLQQLAASLKLRNVIFIDMIPKSEIIDYWSLLDVSIVHLKNDDLFKTVIPSKMFEGMAMGIPIAHGVPGESSEIVTTNGLGMLFEPEDAADLSRVVLKLKNRKEEYLRMKSNSIICAKSYDRNELAHKMLRRLGSLI